MTHFLYVLRESDAAEVRYVGHTCNPATRLSRHLAAADDTHKDRWIRSLLLKDVTPVMEIVAEVESEERVVLMEIEAIRALRQAGARLVNSTDGGEGCSGYVLTEEQRNRINMALSCNPNPHLSDETKAKLSASLSGRTMSPESNARRSASMIAQYASRDPLKEAERLAKVGAALRGRRRTPEQCENIRRGRAMNPPVLTEESRRLLSEAGKKGAASRNRSTL